MAKGDRADAQAAINNQGQIAQTGLTNLNNQMYNNNQSFNSLFNNANQSGQEQQNALMGNYQDFYNKLSGAPPRNSVYGGTGTTGGSVGGGFTGLAGNSGLGGISPNSNSPVAGGGPDNSNPFAVNKNLSGNVNSAISGYQNFANTGGFSPQDIQDIRARAIAPTRAIYAQGQADIDRQRSLQGGYSPNYTAASAKMARDESQQISDANTNANAAIAQMRQQGQLAGLGGMTNAALQQQGLEGNLAGMGANAQLAALEGQNRTLSSTPGLLGLYANMLMGNQGQNVNLQALQNQLGLGIMGNQINAAGIPSNYQQALGNVGGTVDVAGKIGRLGAGF